MNLRKKRQLIGLLKEYKRALNEAPSTRQLFKELWDSFLHDNGLKQRDFPSGMKAKLQKTFNNFANNVPGGLTLQDAEQIANGDYDDNYDKYRKVKGWKEFDKVFIQVFEAAQV